MKSISSGVFRTSGSTSDQDHQNPKEAATTCLESFLSDLCFWGGDDNHGDDNKTSPLPHQALARTESQTPHRALSPDSLAIHPSSSSSSLNQTQSFEQVSSQKELRWQAAADPATGRTYYYDTVTLETQWNKPLEIRNWEKHVKRERKRQEKQFFSEMEQNILASLERRELIPGIVASVDELRCDAKPLRQDTHPGVKVRTLSGMDETVLSARLSSLSTSVPNKSSLLVSNGRPPLVPKPQLQKSTKSKPNTGGADVVANSLQTRSPEEPSSPPNNNHRSGHIRHSTGGNRDFAESTIIQPNVAATIQSVCAIFRAHIVQAVQEPPACLTQQQGQQAKPQQNLPFLYLDLFRDSNPLTLPTKVPSLREIVRFYSDYYETSQMQEDTILMSLIYLESLVQHSEGVLRPTPHNWRSLLFSCMVLASKVWDDFSLWNVDFCRASAILSRGGGFSLRRINDLEVAVLTCLQFDVRVTDSVYARYYFRLRSLQIKSGLLLLGNEDSTTTTAEKKRSHCDKPSDSSKLATSLPSSQGCLSSALVQQRSRNNNDRRSKSADWNGVLSSIYQSATSSRSPIPGCQQAISGIVARTSQTLQ